MFAETLIYSLFLKKRYVFLKCGRFGFALIKLTEPWCLSCVCSSVDDVNMESTLGASRLSLFSSRIQSHMPNPSCTVKVDLMVLCDTCFPPVPFFDKENVLESVD